MSLSTRDTSGRDTPARGTGGAKGLRRGTAASPLTDMERQIVEMDRKLKVASADVKAVQRDMRSYAQRLATANRALTQRRDRLEARMRGREQRLADKVKGLSILYEVGQALATTLERDHLLDLIVRLVARHLKARKASLMLIDPETGLMRISSAVGVEKSIMERTVVKVGEGIAGSVAVKGDPILIEDIATDRRFRRPSRGNYHTGSFLSVPLKRQDRILGVLNVSDKRSRDPFDRDDFHLVTTLAAEAAIAVENATLYQRLREQVATLEGLFRARESERRQLLTLINSITDGILAMDLDGHSLFINERARKLLELTFPSREDAVLADVLPQGDMGRFILEDLKAALHSEVARRELTVESATGGRKHFELISLPMRESNGALIGALTVVRDVTDFKDLDQTRSDFLNRASHQLKTPVGLIRGFADTLLKHRDLNEEQRRYFLKLVHGEANRLSEIIENLLDFAQVESKVLRVEMEQVDLGEFLGEFMPAVSARAEEKGITIDASRGQGFPLLETDPHLLREVVRNILDNSLKHTARGGRISVTADWSGPEIVLVISDSGTGIAEADLPHLFEKFYSGASAENPGTGLGLYIAKEIMNTLGGGISVSSRLGEGTSVRLTLPLKGESAE